eukprot:15446705-Alexandrium_andersonii.AAC.1
MGLDSSPSPTTNSSSAHAAYPRPRLRPGCGNGPPWPEVDQRQLPFIRPGLPLHQACLLGLASYSLAVAARRRGQRSGLGRWGRSCGPAWRPLRNFLPFSRRAIAGSPRPGHSSRTWPARVCRPDGHAGLPGSAG